MMTDGERMQVSRGKMAYYGRYTVEEYGIGQWEDPGKMAYCGERCSRWVQSRKRDGRMQVSEGKDGVGRYNGQ